jgi:hypothetical protein
LTVIAAINGKRRFKQARDLFMQPVYLLLRVVSQRDKADKGAPTQVGQPIGVCVVRLEAIRDTLQQPIADMTPMSIVDHREVIDIKDFDGELLNMGRAPRQQATEALAEQGSLGQTGQRIEVRQEVGGVLFVQVLQGEGEVGGDFFEEFELLLADEAGLEGTEEEGADGCLIDSQGQAGDGADAGCQQIVPAADRLIRLGDIVAQDGFTGTHHPAHQSCILGT